MTHFDNQAKTKSSLPGRQKLRVNYRLKVFCTQQKVTAGVSIEWPHEYGLELS